MLKELFRNKLTWIAAVIIIYAYMTTDLKSLLPDTPSKNTSQATLTEKENNQPFLQRTKEKIFKTIQSTQTGKAFIDALISNAIKQRYGNKDLLTIAAEHGHEIILLDLLKGHGKMAACGGTARIHYQAFIHEKTLFDSTYGHQPLTLQLGQAQVIKGLEHGVTAMQTGGKRKIIIPSSFAFDDPHFSNPLIKPGTTLVYEVELIDIPSQAITPLTLIDLVEGKGKKVYCGDTVDIVLSLRSASFPAIKKNYHLILGQPNTSSPLPLALHTALVNMREGGTRRVALTPEIFPFIKNLIQENTTAENYIADKDTSLALEVIVLEKNPHQTIKP